MRRQRLLIVLVLAILSGISAAFLSMDYIRQQATPLIAATPQANLVVAARDMPLGHVITAEDVKTVSWPGDVLPIGYAGAPEEVLGRGVMTPLRANEPVLSNKVADKEAGGGLPIVIPEGMRAVSVRVDDVVAVAGFVTPQTRVDLVLTLTDAPGGGQGRITQVMERLQNVPVLAAGQTIQRDAEGTPQTVSVMTLLVTPEQAELLVLASQEGRIQMALRNMLDMDSISTTGARPLELLGRAAARRPTAGGRTGRVNTVTRPQTTDETHVIETYKGGVRTLIRFNNQ